MIAIAKHQPLTWILAALGGAGLLALGLTLLPTFVWVTQPAPAAVPGFIAISENGVPPYEFYAPIVDHALFTEGRLKDLPGGAAGTQAGPPPLSDYRLAGVIISKDIRIALVERPQTKQIATVHPGDEFDGRVVEEISASGVRLRGANGVEFLALPKIKSGGWAYASSQAIRP